MFIFVARLIHVDGRMIETFSIGYGAGGASGTAYMDKVTIGAAVANSQIIGAANHTTGFKLVKPIDGIRKHWFPSVESKQKSSG